MVHETECVDAGAHHRAIATEICHPRGSQVIAYYVVEAGMLDSTKVLLPLPISIVPA